MATPSRAKTRIARSSVCLVSRQASRPPEGSPWPDRADPLADGPERFAACDCGIAGPGSGGRTLDVDDQDVFVAEVAFGQVVQQTLPRLDVLAADLRLADADLFGHLGQDFLVFPCGNPGRQDRQHPVGQPSVFPHCLVGGDLDLGEFSRPWAFLSQSGLVDAKLTLFQGDPALLRAVW